MDQLEKQVARARRRLVCEQFAHRLIGCLFFSFLAATVAIGLPKVLVVEPLPTTWALRWLVGAGIAGIVAALGWTLFSRRTTLEAAIEIDRRYALRERIASSLSLSATERETEAGQAVISDAIRTADRIDIGQRFRLRITRRAWLLPVPTLTAFCLAIFVGNREASSKPDSANPQEMTKQVKQSVETLRKKIAEKRKSLEKEGLKDAEEILKKIEETSQQLSKQREIDRTAAVVKLNDLGQTLKKRQQQIGGKQELKRQFGKLQNSHRGPFEKISNSIKDGNFGKAAKQVKELQKQLAEGKLTKEQEENLQGQLAEIQEKLAAAANAHQRAMENLQKQIDQQSRQGNLSKAAELQRKFDQLASRQPQTQCMQEMCQRMSKAQQSVKQGDRQQAAEAMGQMAEQLAQMQQELDELDMLDAAMNELEMAKSAIGCKQCQGAGCKTCQGPGTKQTAGQTPGQTAGQTAGQTPGQTAGQTTGQEIGMGSGKGPRPDEENATNLRDTRVRQKPGRGSVVFGGFAEGGNLRGTALEELKEEMTSLGAEPADPLANERLPRSRREHAEQYFRSLRESP